MLDNSQKDSGRAEQSGSAAQRPHSSLALETFQPLVAGMTDFSGQALSGWIEINRQWTTFLSGRFQEDAALVHHLARCRSPQDILGVYTEFFQKAFADYQTEFATMARLGQATVAEVASTTQKAIRTATNDEQCGEVSDRQSSNSARHRKAS